MDGTPLRLPFPTHLNSPHALHHSPRPARLLLISITSPFMHAHPCFRWHLPAGACMAMAMQRRRVVCPGVNGWRRQHGSGAGPGTASEARERRGVVCSIVSVVATRSSCLELMTNWPTPTLLQGCGGLVHGRHRVLLVPTAGSKLERPPAQWTAGRAVHSGDTTGVPKITMAGSPEQVGAAAPAPLTHCIAQGAAGKRWP